MEKMSLLEIQERNAADSKEVLIVFKNKVYDVSGSSLWQTGTHMKRHKAGEELTLAITAAPHGEEVLERFPIVGELTVQSPAQKSPGGLLGKLLDIHPHPVSVHFPIALIMTAALLTALGWFIKSESLITAGYINLVIGTLATPVAILTGLLSFHYNYGHKWTKTFRMKLLLSICFLGIALTAVLIHAAEPSLISTSGQGEIMYFTLVFCLPPIVGATGYLGGTITFPR